MSSSGNTDEVIGSIKETGGKVLGSKQMEAEGRAQYAQGEAKIEAEKSEQRATGTSEQAKGSLKETGGKVLGSKQMEYEGKGEKLKGEARREANQ